MAFKYKIIGSLFTGKQAKGSGDEYWTGRINVDGKEIRITVYRNKNKWDAKKPDLIIYGEGGGRND